MSRVQQTAHTPLVGNPSTTADYGRVARIQEVFQKRVRVTYPRRRQRFHVDDATGEFLEKPQVQ